jgi:hypothetical protein
MLTIMINPAYIATKFPNLTTPSQLNSIVVALEDASLNGSNTPLVPDPRTNASFNGWQKVTYQSRTRIIFVTVNGVQLEEEMLKMSAGLLAQSSVGGGLTNNLAMAIQAGTLIAYNHLNVLLSYNDVLTANF